MIEFILDNEKEKEEVKDKIEKCLETLYWLEDFTAYEQPKIGECINLLQDIEVKTREDN